MGGERASTTRMRQSGRICCSCRVPLASPPANSRERFCDRCEAARRPRHKVYLHFMANGAGWYCQFLEADLKTPLRRTLTFFDEEKIWELAKRGGAKMMLEDKHALEVALRMGRGSIWLFLTEEQYAKLNGACSVH